MFDVIKRLEEWCYREGYQVERLSISFKSKYNEAVVYDDDGAYCNIYLIDGVWDFEED